MKVETRRMLIRIGGAAAAYTAAAYCIDVIGRRHRALRDARAYARSVGKPVLNVGAGTWGSSLTGPKLDGDVNCDVAAARVLACTRDQVCYCDAQSMPQFADKQFGALVASHVLEHLPNPTAALREWTRVADRLWVIVPSWWAPHTWLHPGHYWYFPKADPHATPIALWPQPTPAPTAMPALLSGSRRT